MKDPGLPPSHFSRDQVVAVRLLAGPGAWRALGKARGRGPDFQGPAPLRLRLPAPDLAGLDCLALSVGNPGREPLLAGLYLWYDAPGRPPLAFSGGRGLLPPGAQTSLLFGRADFGTYGAAGPWARVRALELVVAREKGSGPGQAALRLGELWGQRRLEPSGPRLSAKGLAALLVPKARTGPALHTLDHPGRLLPPPHWFPRSSAGELLDGVVLGERIGFPPDWGGDPRQALEWRHFLHRHHDLRTLALAWATSGRPVHAQALRRLLKTWISGQPVPVGSNGGAGPAWETLSAAWRLLEWLWLRGLAWEALGPRLRDLMRRSLWEHARHLSDHQGHPNNWSLIEAAALALAGMAWPEFAEAAGWRRLGLRRLAAQCRRQFAPHGAHCELSPFYQALCLQCLLMTRRACLAGPWPWPRAAQAALTRGLDYLAALARPDFTWPALNDSGGVRGDYTALFAWAGQDFKRPAWRWLGSRGQEGAPPRPGSRRLEEAGLVVLGGGEPGEGLWLLLRAGPPGLAHAHQDSLSLEVHARRPRVVDPGISSYAPGSLAQGYRRASAHSQPLLDGQGARTGPDAIRKERAAGLWLAWARGATPGGAGLERRVCLVRQRYWLVWDRAWGLPGEHDLQVGWQLFPDRWRFARRERALEAPDGFGLRLLHAPPGAALDLARGRRRPQRGWVSLDGQDVVAHHWRLLARGLLPMQALWLLAPHPGYQVMELSAAWEELSLVVRGPAGELDHLVLGAEPGRAGALGRYRL